MDALRPVSLIERVALAIAEETHANGHPSRGICEWSRKVDGVLQLCGFDNCGCKNAARVAIETTLQTIREPTAAMIDAGWQEIGIATTWADIIDAALKEASMTYATIPFCVSLPVGQLAELVDIEGEADVCGSPSYWDIDEIRLDVFGGGRGMTAPIDGTTDLANALRAAIKDKLLTDAIWCGAVEIELRQVRTA